MGGFRAKDADRDRFVELIEAAYVDGQLGSADRDLRVGRALSAETLDELQTLTRDLQAPAHVVAPSPTRPAGLPRVRRVTGVLAGLGVFVVLVGLGVTGIVALAMFAAVEESDTSTSQGAQPAPVVSEEASVVPGAASFRMTAPQVRRFLRAYEEQFGTLDTWEAGFYPARVGVQVPVRGPRPRMERWSWNGAWRQDTEASAVTRPGGSIDLGALDVRRLFTNIERAGRTLGVQRGRLTHVLVNTWSDGSPTVNIYIGNDADETGYLKTTLAGDFVRAFPYAG